MDGVDNVQAGNIKGRWSGYKWKKFRNDQGVPNFCDKYLVVVLQLLEISYWCYNNNYKTKLWDPTLTFYIYIHGFLDTVF